HLRVLTAVNLAFVVLLDTYYSQPTSVVPGGRRAFWFPGKDVRVGDNVVLYSGRGYSNEATNLDGTTNHFFYWGLPETIWGNPASAVVVLDVLDWQTSVYGLPTPLAPGPIVPSRSGLASIADLLAKEGT